MDHQGGLPYHYPEVITGNDRVSILHPLDGGRRRAGDVTLKDDVHGLLGVSVGGSRQEPRRN